MIIPLFNPIVTSTKNQNFHLQSESEYLDNQLYTPEV